MHHPGIKAAIHAGILSGFALEHHIHTQVSCVLSGQCIYNFSIFPAVLIHWAPSTSFVNRLNWHTNKENTVSQHQQKWSMKETDQGNNFNAFVYQGKVSETEGLVE